MTVATFDPSTDPRFLSDDVGAEIAEFERAKRDYDLQLNVLNRLRHTHEPVDRYLTHLEEIGAVRRQVQSGSLSDVHWGKGEMDLGDIT